MRPRLFVSPVFGLMLVLTLAMPAAGVPDGVARQSVIVVFDDSVPDPAAFAARLGSQHGFEARHVYRTALKGFVASVPAAAVAALAAQPSVLSVEHEVAERIVGETLPTGIDRIEVDRNPETGVGGEPGPDIGYHVAIIDTGISPHPDLNIGPGASFAGGDTSDGNGHGTHVAGTVAGRDNGDGVVGVAPGAIVHPVKVCKNGGICLSGDIVAGIDWVAEQKANGIDFAAANFSISSSDTTSSCTDGRGVNATHTAICRVVSAGVVFAMAAGNDARLKNAYPEAFTVAAIADFDGRGGKKGAPSCRTDEDDTLANFSNWNVDIAAPGTCILSTWNDGGYNTISGTSMATPHVTGAVALYLHANSLSPATDGGGVATIETAISHAALAQSHACGYTNERGTPEKLLFVNATTFGDGGGTCNDGTGDPDGGVGDGGGGDDGGGGTSGSVHIGELAAASSNQGPWWKAHVTIMIHDESHAGVSDATVSGEWDTGATSSCTTDSSGTCQVTLVRIPDGVSSVDFEVSGITHPTAPYDATLNHVTIVTVSQ